MKQYFAPGRINLIGEHLDYNGGFVMPAAISLGISAKVTRNKSRLYTLSSEGHPTVNIPFLEKLFYEEKDTWANYPKGIIAVCQSLFDVENGGTISYSSTLPEGSGLSSSAALEVLTAYILHDLHNEKISKRSLALLCQKVENQFIGVNCGIMDQYAVANGKQNTALLLDCQNVRHEDVPLYFGEYQLIVMDTCKPRALRESKYNERRSECEAALALIQKDFPVLNLAAANSEQVNQCIKDEIVKKRALHVVSEQQRVLDAAKYLKNNALLDFGKLLNASHLSLQNDYEVSGIELDTLVESAWKSKYCLGARMTGAGFGGCAIALVQKEHLAEFTDTVTAQYLAIIGYECKLYNVEIVDGAGAIND